MTAPQLRQHIRDIVCGDSLRIDRTILDVPSDLTITKAWFTVKANASDADAAAILQLTITTTPTSSGQILDDGATTLRGSVRFTLLPEQTLLLPAQTLGLDAPAAYTWDIQVLMSDTGLYTPFRGTILGQAQVTKATS